MVFADNGNLYATQNEDDSVWCITPDGVPGEFVTGVGGPVGIVWAAGTSYGDYLYVAITSWGVIRIRLDGTTSNFGYRRCAGALGLDRTGNYGGYMYTTTGCVDHTYRVSPDGGVTMFSNWPGHTDGGGPHNIAFDTGGDYDGLMYVASAFGASNPHVSGVFVLDPSGKASRFTSDLVRAQAVDFDSAGYFGGEMFVVGRAAFGQPDSLWRVRQDGTATKFAELTAVSPHGLTFGADGAMYVGEYFQESQAVVISRVTSWDPCEVAVDIKPGSCRNPLNLGSRGVLPIGILGSEDFDVNNVDPTSIRLKYINFSEGVGPIRSSVEDVAAPVVDGNECDCSAEGPDGYMDLTLKFKAPQIATELLNTAGELVEGQELLLTIAGQLYDGTQIEGSDCIVLVGKVPEEINIMRADINKDGKVGGADFLLLKKNWYKTVPNFPQ
jgi:hypothetical protein